MTTAAEMTASINDLTTQVSGIGTKVSELEAIIASQPAGALPDELVQAFSALQAQVRGVDALTVVPSDSTDQTLRTI